MVSRQERRKLLRKSELNLSGWIESKGLTVPKHRLTFSDQDYQEKPCISWFEINGVEALDFSSIATAYAQELDIKIGADDIKVMTNEMGKLVETPVGVPDIDEDEIILFPRLSEFLSKYQNQQWALDKTYLHYLWHMIQRKKLGRIPPLGFEPSAFYIEDLYSREKYDYPMSFEEHPDFYGQSLIGIRVLQRSRSTVHKLLDSDQARVIDFMIYEEMKKSVMENIPLYERLVAGLVRKVFPIVAKLPIWRTPTEDDLMGDLRERAPRLYELYQKHPLLVKMLVDTVGHIGRDSHYS